MGVLRNILLAICLISVVTFVALFGQLPTLRRTPIGWLNRLLRVHIPNALAKLDGQVTGGRITLHSKRFGHYLFYQKNPIVLIIFLILLTGSAGLFLPYALPRLPLRLIIPIPPLLFAPYIFTYLSTVHRSHHVNSRNHRARILDYPYDFTLFHPGKTCSTCNLLKPARSKHCSLCGTCVAMADHHCPWINNCVGRGNYRYFLGLLLSLGVLELYGAYLSYHILRPVLATNSSRSFFSKAYWSKDFLRMAVVAVQTGGLSIAGVGMLAVATGFLPLGLLAYHCYLVWAGMTTNESLKWADWRDEMGEGVVFRGSRMAVEAHERTRKGVNGNANGVLVGTDELPVPWPLENDQILARFTDGRPPEGEEHMWTQVWSLNDVVNIYDRGGWTNFVELLKGR